MLGEATDLDVSLEAKPWRENWELAGSAGIDSKASKKEPGSSESILVPF